MVYGLGVGQDGRWWERANCQASNVLSRDSQVTPSDSEAQKWSVSSQTPGQAADGDLVDSVHIGRDIGRHKLEAHIGSLKFS